jgi:hypothetical protein
MDSWDIVNRLAAVLATGYLLIELNTAYALIRQRTTLHLSAFLLLAVTGCALPLTAAEAWAAPLFLAAVHQLFATYESPQAAIGALNMGLALGTGSFVCPPMAWLLPLMALIGLYQMRALSVRSFCAAWIGGIAPWWCYYGVMYAWNEETCTPDRLLSLLETGGVDYALVTAGEMLTAAVLALTSVVCGVHYALVSYMDKVRTRLHLSFLVFLVIVLAVMLALQPRYAGVWLTMWIPLAALQAGHLFTLTRTRVMRYYFVAFLILYLALPVACIWIH